MKPSGRADSTPRATSVVILGADAVLAAVPATAVQLAHACLQGGYQAVAPASWGDELLAAEATRLVGARPDTAVFCACPRVAARLLQVGDDLSGLLVSFVTPPVATARYLRAAMRDAPVRITYVGRCPGGGDPEIDARFSPEEFLAVLADRGIVPSEQPETFDSVLPPDRRRFASLPGGAPTGDHLTARASGRTLVEIEPEAAVIDLAQQLSSGNCALLDAAPALGCFCSGAGPGARAPAEARARVAATEPPRAMTPVVDPNIRVPLALPLPARARSPLDVIVPPMGAAHRASETGHARPAPPVVTPATRVRPPVVPTPLTEQIVAPPARSSIIEEEPEREAPPAVEGTPTAAADDAQSGSSEAEAPPLHPAERRDPGTPSAERPSLTRFTAPPAQRTARRPSRAAGAGEAGESPRARALARAYLARRRAGRDAASPPDHSITGVPSPAVPPPPATSPWQEAPPSDEESWTIAGVAAPQARDGEREQRIAPSVEPPGVRWKQRLTPPRVTAAVATARRASRRIGARPFGLLLVVALAVLVGTVIGIATARSPDSATSTAGEPPAGIESNAGVVPGAQSPPRTTPSLDPSPNRTRERPAPPRRETPPPPRDAARIITPPEDAPAPVEQVLQAPVAADTQAVVPVRADEEQPNVVPDRAPVQVTPARDTMQRPSPPDTTPRAPPAAVASPDAELEAIRRELQERRARMDSIEAERRRLDSLIRAADTIRRPPR